MKINERASDWAAEKTVVLAVSSTKPEKNRASQKLGKLAMTLLSDTDHATARRFTSYDDFEGIELHSTILIDAEGRVRWKRTGGDPFTDIDFLIRELKRINKPATGAIRREVVTIRGGNVRRGTGACTVASSEANRVHSSPKREGSQRSVMSARRTSTLRASISLSGSTGAR